MWWLLAREVMRLRGEIVRDEPWDVMVDLFFYHEAKEDLKEEPEEIKTLKPNPLLPRAASYDDFDIVNAGQQTKQISLPAAPFVEDWNDEETVGQASDWGGVNVGF